MYFVYGKERKTNKQIFFGAKITRGIISEQRYINKCPSEFGLCNKLGTVSSRTIPTDEILRLDYRQLTNDRLLNRGKVTEGHKTMSRNVWESQDHSIEVDKIDQPTFFLSSSRFGSKNPVKVSTGASNLRTQAAELLSDTGHVERFGKSRASLVNIKDMKWKKNKPSGTPSSDKDKCINLGCFRLTAVGSQLGAVAKRKSKLSYKHLGIDRRKNCDLTFTKGRSSIVIHL